MQIEEQHNANAEAHGPTDDTNLLHQYVFERDVPCPVCAYNLRNSMATECPECGATLELRVGSIDLRLRWWLCSLVAFALPIGFASFILTLVGIHALDRMSLGPSQLKALFTFGVVIVINVFGFIALLRARHWFLKRPTIQQRCLAVVLLLWTVLSAAIPIWIMES